jgi:hypothetical protein
VAQGVDPEFKPQYREKKKSYLELGIVERPCNSSNQEAEAGLEFKASLDSQVRLCLNNTLFVLLMCQAPREIFCSNKLLYEILLCIGHEILK